MMSLASIPCAMPYSNMSEKRHFDSEVIFAVEYVPFAECKYFCAYNCLASFDIPTNDIDGTPLNS
jgi:hypothetical protein